MPVMTGHGNLASIPEEHLSDKIRRKVMSGTQGMMVWWQFKAGAHAAAHRHPHEQAVVRWASLKQQNSPTPISGKSVRQHTTGGAGPNNNIVE